VVCHAMRRCAGGSAKVIAYLSRILVLFISLALPAKAQEPTRLALVIRNQAYADKVGPLTNPYHNIAIVAKALETDPPHIHARMPPLGGQG
jgi:hypothetical protein